MKGLEALERLGRFRNEDGMFAFLSKDYFLIKREIKALEIIKNKLVDIDYLIAVNIEDYNEGLRSSCKITKEEYQLLMEVLKDD